MYKDLISYKLAEGVTEAHLLRVAQEIIDNWMKKLPGFVSWEINKGKDGTYTDIVVWETEENAKNAEKEMANIPNAMEWFKCYEQGSISSKGIIIRATFH